MPSASLDALQEQITQRERELQALREELESRQIQLASLTRRKEELLQQLQQVESEIADLGVSVPDRKADRPASAPKPAPKAPPAPAAEGVAKLPHLLVAILRETGKAMTARQLRDEVLRRGYRSTSGNLKRTIETRLQEMKKTGSVRRASGQPGYILPGSAGDAGPGPSAAGPAARGPGKPSARPGQTKKPAPSGKKSTTASGAAKTKQPPLRDVLTEVLKKNRKPASGGELARQVLDTGYQTKSKHFADVVWTALGGMKNVEHVPEKGYRLKKGS
jgi:hypothetical protein